MKISSFLWNAAAYTCKEKLWQGRRWVSNVIISILLKKEWLCYVGETKYHIYMDQLSLQSLENLVQI